MHPEPSPATRTLDEAVSTFVRLRPRLFGIAYRVLGSATEAEDVVQDAWLRWDRTDRSVVVDPAAFLARTATRLAINVAQSARLRRETYLGPWLPEPLDTSADPAVGAQRAEALELAVLLLLQKLGPTERAAYVLREAFDYPYAQIADILRLSVVNARQIVSRARKHLAAEQREPVGFAEHRRLLEAFIAAAQSGDVTSLEGLLASDAISYSDGNGIRGAARVPVRGRARVAMLSSMIGKYLPNAAPRRVEVNGQAGVLLHQDDAPVVLMTFTASHEGIRQVMWMMNPEKLAVFARSRHRSTEAVVPGHPDRSATGGHSSLGPRSS
ncbi:RNA polymerase sigma factor SigJ [Streptomyces sp. NPDC048473]|uniref:RNA polymerase sigma factor SigJ n=1 Tax=unclassified Streptomyces TaxID=2593676 RepID=UPI003714B651